MVSLKYQFLFNRNDNIFGNLFEFERDLADFFAANGLEAEIVPVIEGSAGERIMMIKRIEIIDKLTNKPDANTPKSSDKQNPQPSYKMVKKLTDSIGKGKRA